MPIIVKRLEQGKLDPYKLPDDIISLIPQAADAAIKLAQPFDENVLNVYLTNVLRLIAMSAHPADRADWLDAMIDSFKDEPGHLVIEAINHVSKQTSALWDFHRMVGDYIKDDAKYLKKRARQYNHLMLLIENRKV